jgi:hypothetical protein
MSDRQKCITIRGGSSEYIDASEPFALDIYDAAGITQSK